MEGATAGSRGERAGEGELPHPRSLCHLCAALRYVKGRATTFLRCTALPAKYPPQPVLRCDAFRPVADAASRDLA